MASPYRVPFLAGLSTIGLLQSAALMAAMHAPAIGDPAARDKPKRWRSKNVRSYVRKRSSRHHTARCKRRAERKRRARGV